MDMNKLTEKSQEVLQAAQQKAVAFGHQQVDPRHLMLVAIEDDLVVGMASAVEYFHPDKPPQMWINEVVVSPAWQRRGTGRALSGTDVATWSTRAVSTAAAFRDPKRRSERNIVVRSSSSEWYSSRGKMHNLRQLECDCSRTPIFGARLHFFNQA